MDTGLNEENTPNEGVSPSFVLDKLINKPYSTNREWLVQPAWTMDQVRRMVQVREEEVFFTEQDGRLFVTERVSDPRLVSDERYRNDKLRERIESGRLVGHIHPKYPYRYSGDMQLAGYTHGLSLSWNDIFYMLGQTDFSRKHLLFHIKGGLEFTIPNRDGLKPYEIFKLFLEKENVGFSPLPRGRSMNSLLNLGIREQDLLASKFTDFANMRRKQDLWDNGDGM